VTEIEYVREQGICQYATPEQPRSRGRHYTLDTRRLWRRRPAPSRELIRLQGKSAVGLYKARNQDPIQSAPLSFGGHRYLGRGGGGFVSGLRCKST
jgi:hypothetical protein